MSYRDDGTPACDMKADCTEPVTHIGEKGYIYCTLHAPDRWQLERVRKMRPHELNRIKRGEPL